MSWIRINLGSLAAVGACIAMVAGCGGQPGGPPLPEGAVSMPPAPEPQAFTGPLPEPAAPTGTDLIINGGFEEWVPPLPYLWRTGSENYIEAYHDAPAGDLALLLKPSPRGDIAVTQYLPLGKMSTGKRLTAEVTAKATASDEAFIEVLYTTPGGVQRERAWCPPSNSWERIEVEATLPANLRPDSVGIRLGRASGSRGFVAFDECSARLIE